MKKVAGGKSNMTLFALLYGQAKLRKTTAALMAPPSWRPIAYLDTDVGAAIRLKVLSTPKEERERLGIVEKIPEVCGPWMREGIDFYYPEKGSYYADAFEFATQIAKDYKLVVIDTLSRLADGIIDEVKSTNYGAVSKRVTMGTGKHATIHPVPADFGMAQDRIMELLAVLDHGPTHTLVISHEKTGEIREGEVVKRTLAGPRTVGNALLEVIPSVVDVALRLAVKSEAQAGKITNKVIVRTTNHDIYLAGDRSGIFPDGEEFDPVVMWDRFGKLINMTAEPSKE